MKLLIFLLLSSLLLVEGSSRQLLAKKGGGKKNKGGKKGGNGSGSSSAASYVPRKDLGSHESRLIVKYKTSTGADGESISGSGGKWRRVKTKKGESVAAAMKRLKADGNVASVEEDFVMSALDAAPSDPEFSNQWGWGNAGTLGAWSANVTGSSSVKVCVIDTGIARSHADLSTNTASGTGYSNGNVVSSDDENSHGSHCAGVIGASVDSIGVAGMNKAVQMIPCRFLDANGSGYLSDAILCLNYCVAQGAEISSNSWGGGGYSQAMVDAIRAARSAGHLFIAAAGNSGGY